MKTIHININNSVRDLYNILYKIIYLENTSITWLDTEFKIEELPRLKEILKIYNEKSEKYFNEKNSKNEFCYRRLSTEYHDKYKQLEYIIKKLENEKISNQFNIV